MVLVGHAQALPDVVQVLPQHGLAMEEELEIVPPVRRNSGAPHHQAGQPGLPGGQPQQAQQQSSTGRAFQRKSSGLPPQLIPPRPTGPGKKEAEHHAHRHQQSTRVTRAERRGWGSIVFCFPFPSVVPPCLPVGAQPAEDLVTAWRLALWGERARRRNEFLCMGWGLFLVMGSSPPPAPSC